MTTDDDNIEINKYGGWDAVDDWYEEVEFPGFDWHHIKPFQ